MAYFFGHSPMTSSLLVGSEFGAMQDPQLVRDALRGLGSRDQILLEVSPDGSHYCLVSCDANHGFNVCIQEADFGPELTLIDPEKPIRPMILAFRHDLALFAAREWVTTDQAVDAVAYFAKHRTRNYRQWWARRVDPTATDIRAGKKLFAELSPK